MPKRKQGGTNNTRPRQCNIVRMPMQYADSKYSQLYARVTKALGNTQFNVMTLNGDSRLASPGKSVKKTGAIRENDVVLIEPLSTNENGKYRIAFHYTPVQEKMLEKEGHLKKIEDPTKKEDSVETVTNLMDDFDIEDDGFAFEGEMEAREEQTLVIDEDFIDLI